MRVAVAALAFGLLGGGCKKPHEIGGLGPWNVTRTTLAQATGHCEPTDLPDGRKGSWCFGQPMLKVAGLAADVDLYFDGTAPSSKLIELQLDLHGCDESTVDNWMRGVFGAPYQNASTRAYWKNRYLFAAAFLPLKPGECMIRILPASEATEFDRIRGL